MDDFNQKLRQLAQAKLKQAKPQIVETTKPVFALSDPNKPTHYRMSGGKPDAEPIDYVALNNPGKAPSTIDRPDEDPRVQYESLKRAFKESSQPQFTVESSMISPQEKALDDRAVDTMIYELSQAKTKQEKGALFDDMMENGDLSEYEKEQLRLWASQDAQRTN